MDESVTPYYTSSLQHITAELSRLDLLIRVQVWRVRQARQSDENLSPFYIPEDEIDTLLDQEIGLPLWAIVPLPPEMVKNLQAQLDQMTTFIIEIKAASIAEGVALRLDQLAQHFHLTPLDQDILLVALAPEIDLRYGRLYAYLQDNVTHRHPSVDLALSLLHPDFYAKMAAQARLTAEAPLLRHHLLYLWHDPANPHPAWLDYVLTVDKRIVRYLLDGDEPDERVATYLEVVSPSVALDDLRLPGDHATKLATLTEQQSDLVLYLQGKAGVGKQTTADALCRKLNQQLCVVNGQRLLAEVKAENFASVVQLIEREVRLQGAALYWEGFDALLADDKASQRLAFFATLANRPGLTFLAGQQVWEPDRSVQISSFLRVEFPLADYNDRHQLWGEALAGAVHGGGVRTDAEGLPVEAGIDPQDIDTAALAATFRFSAGQIFDSVNTARDLARWRNPEAPRIEEDDLYTASRLHSNRKLTELAQKIEPHYSWDDIVLPTDKIEQLRGICDQVKYRGRVYDDWGFDGKLAMGKGISALFAGPPGTGKTMSADIIAHELGLDLYKIDLSTVVSKFIGETEKNLSRIFDEAETSNAILFFDEADALFGKRTEVRDSHDRYANLEISYLLQKMEEYEGMVILATNLHKNMDDAFTRRLHFIIEFPLPDAENRRHIWEQIWPAETPRCSDLDLDFIAQEVAVSGGNIRNIALAAAFLAAADGQTVTMPHLVRATQREYTKIGKLLTGREFDAILGKHQT